ncbi:cupin domain-containing protein [Thalassovita aquimarina]|uniref:Cupin domain-containing protein n=1 Tax=Thalassovita aquimarina TaxID=2785917 RepID=A0ABS5HN05_9RHOB|nr:cupin domain-containing protein [Thalassovita aquimarina]MBR9650349.1 cupin domain-containing protein [Thalassovita aquimarina]
MANDTENLSPIRDLGARLRAERQKQGLTLKDVSELAGCSLSMLSKIENDQASPSLKTLHQITSALNTSIVRLFSEDGGDGVSLYRSGQRPSVMVRRRSDQPAIFIERLSPTYPDTRLDANIHTLEPGAESGGDIRHEGEEIGYVLEGAAELCVNGEIIPLTEGDSFYFSSELPHSYRNTHEGTTRILWVNTPPTF